MRVAILDDDGTLRAQLVDIVRQQGHLCFDFAAGKLLIKALREQSFDLLLLDWEVPDLSGIEVLDWTTRNLDPGPKVIIITARTEEGDIVRGLEAGADDYVTKPISAEVLKARMAAVLRRTNTNTGTPGIEDFGRYRFHHLSESVWVDGEEVATTAKEFHLALLLFQNIHRSLSRAHILEEVWGRNPDLPTRTLDAHISQIRSRLKLRPEYGLRLSSVYSFGYRLEALDQVIATQ